MRQTRVSLVACVCGLCWIGACSSNSSSGAASNTDGGGALQATGGAKGASGGKASQSGGAGNASGGIGSSAGGIANAAGGLANAAGGSSPITTTGSYLPSGGPWTKDISQATPDPMSGAIIGWLNQQGFGTGQMRIDFSIEVLMADATTPQRAFQATKDFYSPDCDQVAIPVPVGGNLEGETGYQCAGNGDCHLIVVDRASSKLFEMWRANIAGPTFMGGCLAVWDLSRVYGEKGRGEGCTSADAAGYPIAPLLFSADEVKAGSIAHAIRFILPNSSIRAGEYVHPATHTTGAASGPNTAPPYGARLRLRADFPLASLPSEGARVVARTLQKYGMLLADGGNIALTAQSDVHTQAKWAGLLDSHDLVAITPGDFEVLALGATFPLAGDCVREP